MDFFTASAHFPLPFPVHAFCSIIFNLNGVHCQSTTATWPYGLFFVGAKKIISHADGTLFASFSHRFHFVFTKGDHVTHHVYADHPNDFIGFHVDSAYARAKSIH